MEELLEKGLRLESPCSGRCGVLARLPVKEVCPLGGAVPGRQLRWSSGVTSIDEEGKRVRAHARFCLPGANTV